MVIILLTSIVNASNHTKCVFLNDQQCMTQPTLINSDPNERIEGLQYCPFAVNLDRGMGSCNTFDDLSNRIHIFTFDDLCNRILVFNMVIRIN